MSFFKDFGLYLYRRGFQPIPVEGKRPVLPSWPVVTINETNINGWVRAGYGDCNVGIRNQPALDLDITHEGLAKATEDKIREMLGPLGIRYGKAPKGLVIVQCDAPRKMQSPALIDPATGDTCRIEYLAVGQQFVVLGVHPDTGEEYTWKMDPGVPSPLKAGPDEAPAIRTEQIQELFDWFEQTGVGMGLTATKKKSPMPPSDPTLMPPGQRSVVRSEIRTAIDQFNHNGFDKFVEMLAEHGWSPAGRGAFEAEGETVRTWLFTRPGKDTGVSASLYCSPRTGIWQFQNWSTSVDGLEADTAYIGHIYAVLYHDGDYARAAQALTKMGFEPKRKSAEEDFAGLSEESIIDTFLRRFVFITAGRSVADTELPPEVSVMKLEEFKDTYKNVQVPGKKGMRDVSSLWMENPDRETVRDVRYAPGQDRIFTDERGVRYYNKFSMPDWMPMTEDEDRVSVPLEHFAYLLGPHRDYYLGWLAHIVTAPGLRPAITPLLISTYHGTGRGWIDELVKKLVGHWNCSSTTISDLCNVDKFSEYLADTIFCSVPEARGHGMERYEIDDAIRDRLTANHINVNRKYGAKGYTEVFTAFSFSSNHLIPFKLDPVDRRIFVVECLEKPREIEYYNRLYKWLDDPENLRQFYWWLNRFRCTKSTWHPKAPAPTTREKMALCNLGASNEVEQVVSSVAIDDSLPAVVDFRRMHKVVQTRLTALAHSLGDPGISVPVPKKQLESIMDSRFRQPDLPAGWSRARKGGDTKDGLPVGTKIYILRDRHVWVKAPPEQIRAELERWGSVSQKKLEEVGSI